MNKVEALNPSGTNHQDRLGMAAKMFKEIEGKTFGFLHLLGEHPKWAAHLVNKRQKTNDLASPASSPACGGSNDAPVGDDLPRPIDRDSAKKARARGASSSSSHGSITAAAYSDHFVEMNQHKATLIELRREEVSIMKEENSDKVMSMDLDKMDAMSREYFRKRKEDIVMRMFAPREN